MQDTCGFPRGAGLLTVAVAALLAACAGGSFEARPEEIPALEQTVTRSPRDTEAATRLGVAYFLAGRHEDARRTLTSAIEAGAAEGAAYLYLGLAHEELEQWADARVAYDRYLETGTDDRVRGEIRGRLSLISRQEMRAAARAALEREQVLSTEAPTPNTIAVLPFRITGLSEDMEPLQTALADMIITDLGLTPLQSLERVRIRSMVDEMLLTQTGLATRETGARMGRLLKAEHVVQGMITGTGDQLVVDASVLATQRDDPRELNRSGSIDAIFDIEKDVVFAILDALGVEITQREREAITSNRTGSLVAFLAYGRGLEAMDRGDYGEALQQFQQATRLDPGFGAARAQEVESAQAADAAAVEPAQVGETALAEVGAVSGDLAGDIVNQVNFSPATSMTQPGTDGTAPGKTGQERTSGDTSPQSTLGSAVRQPVIITVPNPNRPGGN